MKIDIILIFIFRNVREQMARSLVKLKEYEKQVNFSYQNCNKRYFIT